MNYLIPNSSAPNAKSKQKFTQNFVTHSLKIQKTFFHALVVLFNNFIPFISKGEDGIISVKTEEYLNILQDKLHRSFMKQISKTMVFIRLCQYHVDQSERCAWVQKTLGQLFVYSHDILSHKFVVTTNQDSKQNVNQQSLKNNKKVYSWKIKDLFQEKQKYYQYVEYLFNKNLKQILNVTNAAQIYFSQEQNKYRIILGQDQYESFQSLQSIQISANFGKKQTKKTSSPLKKSQKDIINLDQSIYEQIRSQQVMKSRKNKKFGEKDENDIYEQFSKICKDLKIQKYLVKYLKLMELNQPETILKVNQKKHKKKKQTGIIDWLWDLINPPDMNRSKQQSDTRKKLHRKNTIKNISNMNILNINEMFQSLRINEDLQNGLQLQKKEKENNQVQTDKKRRIQEFASNIKQKGRVSHTQSEIINEIKPFQS